ncbi:MAG: hypothetical protein ABL880_10750 [Methylotenera sp.]
MKKIPSEVINSRNYFLQNQFHELSYVADKLIVNPPLAVEIDLAKMWSEYLKNPPKLSWEIQRPKLSDKVVKVLDEQRRKAQQDRPELFVEPPIDKKVYDLLVLVNKFIKPPIYHQKSKQDRKFLEDDISKLAQRLAILLEVNQIDVPIHYTKEFGCTALLLIDGKKTDAHAPTLIREIAEIATSKINAVVVNAKDGTNKDAIMFIRRLLQHNNNFYEKAHHTRIAIIANAIYGTQYDKTNITQFKNRVVKMDDIF